MSHFARNMPIAFYEILVRSLEEQRVIPVDEDSQHDERQDVGDIEADPLREGDAFAGVGFFDEVVPAPAVAARAESEVDEAAEREEVVADEEVFEIEDARARAEGLEAAPDIEAEHAWEREHDHRRDADLDDFVAVRMRELEEADNEILEDGDNRRHRRERHEEEEQRAPDAAEGHVLKDVRQRDEEQVRARGRTDAIGKACRKNDEARHDGDERVEHDDPARLARQALRLADVAAEDCKRADAEREREERLPHRREDDFLQAVFHDFREVRHQVVFEARFTAVEQHGVRREDNHEAEQADHHDLRDALDARLHTEVADTAAEADGQCHKARHRQRVSKQAAEDFADTIGIEADERA